MVLSVGIRKFDYHGLKGNIETSVPVRNFQISTVLGTKEYYSTTYIYNFWISYTISDCVSQDIYTVHNICIKLRWPTYVIKGTCEHDNIISHTEYLKKCIILFYCTICCRIILFKEKKA